MNINVIVFARGFVVVHGLENTSHKLVLGFIVFVFQDGV